MIREKKLTFADGIPLAFGSIMGSGILFLPALTYRIAGAASIFSWLLAVLLCVPLLIVFKDMFSRVSGNEGIAGYISKGMSQSIGESIPVLFLGTVCLGMPSAAVIAGNYLGFGLPSFAAAAFAFSIPWISTACNLMGIKIGSRTQTLITFLLVFLVIGIFLLTDGARESFEVANSNYELSRVLLALTAAFWAFAGFENISFMAGDFKNPKRDLFFASIAALLICGVLYGLMVVRFIQLVPISSINVGLGLLQLADFSAGGGLLKRGIGLFAYTSVLLNFNSWMWGISRMIEAEAVAGRFPYLFAKRNRHSMPVAALLGLAIVFSCVISFAVLRPENFESLLILVSGNFVLVYILCTIAYVRLNKNCLSRLVGMLVSLVLFGALIQTGLSLLYPILVVGVFLLARHYRTRAG